MILGKKKSELWVNNSGEIRMKLSMMRKREGGRYLVWLESGTSRTVEVGLGLLVNLSNKESVNH